MTARLLLLTALCAGAESQTYTPQASDGTSHLLFDPMELLEKLAAITPRPTISSV